MGRHAKATAEKREEIKLLWEQDVHPIDIAQEVEVSVSTVYRVANELGLLANVQDREGPEISPEKEAKIIEQYLYTTTPITDIARDVGVSLTTFYTILREAGIDKSTRANKMREEREKVLNLAIAMYEDGATYAEIKKETGVGSTLLASELREREVPSRRPRKNEIKRAVKKLRAQGEEQANGRL